MYSHFDARKPHSLVSSVLSKGIKSYLVGVSMPHVDASIQNLALTKLPIPLRFSKCSDPAASRVIVSNYAPLAIGGEFGAGIDIADLKWFVVP